MLVCTVLLHRLLIPGYRSSGAATAAAQSAIFTLPFCLYGFPASTCSDALKDSQQAKRAYIEVCDSLTVHIPYACCMLLTSYLQCILAFLHSERGGS